MRKINNLALLELRIICFSHSSVFGPGNLCGHDSESFIGKGSFGNVYRVNLVCEGLPDRRAALKISRAVTKQAQNVRFISKMVSQCILRKNDEASKNRILLSIIRYMDITCFILFLKIYFYLNFIELF